MLTPQESTRFRRDLRRMKKRGKDLEKLKTVVELLVQEQILPERYREVACSKACLLLVPRLCLGT
ncbi:MAG: type II toxin-antitoxin system YafQ family toxin, partial [Microcystis sp.]